MFDLRFWKKTHNLGRLTLPGLVRAYFSYLTIWTYIILAMVSCAIVVWNATTVLPLLMAAMLTVLIYPFAEYLLHRFVLHGRFLYRSRWTAATWKRIHFDHHQDPNDLRILFGALYTTLPTIALVTCTVGWLVDGPVAAVAAFVAAAVAAGVPTAAVEVPAMVATSNIE